MPPRIWPYTYSGKYAPKTEPTEFENALAISKNTPAKAAFREFARAQDLINTKMTFAERNKLITTMIVGWTGECMASYPPQHTKQSMHEIKCTNFIMLSRSTTSYATIAQHARFDLETYHWLCKDCFYKKYPKVTSVGWTSKLPKPKIQSAKEIYETTGTRYKDTEKGKHKLSPLFDKSKANYNLTKELPSGNNRGWVKYRCPHCPDFYACLRAYQGYPEHQCPVTTLPANPQDGNWK